MSTVLITGAASGFGRRTAATLRTAGHTVVGSMRDVAGRNATAAADLTAAGVHVVEIDVTDDASVDRGVQQAIDATGAIDVVINNAGQGSLGLQEGFTAEQWRNVFDINVIGVQRVNRAVLPHMKARRHGLLIQISSLSARLAIPFQGPYSPSKSAVETLAEVYRAELSPFGIDSVIVEPNAMPTEFLGRLLTPGDAGRLDDYGDLAKVPDGFLAGFEATFAANPAQQPQLVADAIAELIATPVGERPFRTIVDRLGLGDQIAPYNDHLESVTHQVFASFQIEHLLRVAG
ncbi:SDR family NAD(P)-dependent oxidoreductase [Actinoplanes sp. TBRC 11911]|uniref:SDR family NAD(P)-dependent oxidoreductase n=1 Tax=Actinoplanes sp. TBRC 11911 TaxID=2729386 RepID=UPI00145D0EA1|nr:SDR family NAD(P)-dependent oxidoreductase [Actinoplanes sp. TBRC 11911]NMO49855.1 SDR family NAD(P)-dependent oxidoreductase [Actinoplanes sp. TBRC 11911]